MYPHSPSTAKGAAGSPGSAQQHKPRCVSTVPVPAGSWARSSRAGGPGTALGLLPSCPVPISSPSQPLTGFHPPPVPSSSAQHQISMKMSEQGVTEGGCLSRKEGGQTLPGALYTPSHVSRSCQSLTPVHGGTGGVKRGANQEPWCPAASAPLGSLQKKGCNQNKG